MTCITMSIMPTHQNKDTLNKLLLKSTLKPHRVGSKQCSEQVVCQVLISLVTPILLGPAWLFTCCSYCPGQQSILSVSTSTLLKMPKPCFFLETDFPQQAISLSLQKHQSSSFSSTSSLYQMIHARVLPTLPGCFQRSLSPPPLSRSWSLFWHQL